MATAHTKIFKSNRSQAVRLPKDVALPESVVEVLSLIHISEPTRLC